MWWLWGKKRLSTTLPDPLVLWTCFPSTHPSIHPLFYFYFLVLFFIFFLLRMEIFNDFFYYELFSLSCFVWVLFCCLKKNIWIASFFFLFFLQSWSYKLFFFLYIYIVSYIFFSIYIYIYIYISPITIIFISLLFGHWKSINNYFFLWYRSIFYKHVNHNTFLILHFFIIFSFLTRIEL